MSERANVAAVYVCPMHSIVRQPGPGQCPKCGMDLVPEGTRFAILRHMISSPLHLAAMLGLMLALMVVAMMLMR
jgi:Heavy metal binding domain